MMRSLKVLGYLLNGIMKADTAQDKFPFAMGSATLPAGFSSRNDSAVQGWLGR